MAVVIPAIEGKMGNTKYFQCMMKVDELVRSVRSASEIDEWANMSIGDKMQREPNINRIKNQIAPYFRNHSDRFFGSLIVLVYEGDVSFEKLSKFGATVPNAYQSQGNKMGFLTIDGGTLIALDGQHRLLALKEVKDNPSEGNFSADVPKDEVSVIFIKHENIIKTRNIFNTVNKYAKPTSAGDNIITSEEDGYAILSRRLIDVDGGVLRESVVNWRNNTLTDKSGHFTTIKIVYETIKLMLKGSKEDEYDFDPTTRPPDEILDRAYTYISKTWKLMMSEVKAYNFVVENRSDFVEKVKDARKFGSPNSLLFKPAAQQAFVQGILAACTPQEEDEDPELTVQDAFKKSNKIKWSMEEEIWKHVIIKPSGAIDGGAEGKYRMAQLLSWLLLGSKMSDDKKLRVRKAFNAAHGVDIEINPDDELPLPNAVR
jgi:DNA sulfur modification protein DndB|tara:strand:- start:354 stop:1640 length:1287 start_codon:yes stop_codon:yes gene_type:complete